MNFRDFTIHISVILRVGFLSNSHFHDAMYLVYVPCPRNGSQAMNIPLDMGLIANGIDQ